MLLAFYLLLPFYLLGINLIDQRLLNRELISRIFLVFLGAGALAAAFYLSYPRLTALNLQNFIASQGFDLSAVNYIEQTANRDHMFWPTRWLAPPAIQQQGFKNYYHNQFYYSMPIGQPQRLYDFYLEMVYQGAKRSTMEKAMAEAGVKESYFVINKYWRNFEKIVNQAKTESDEVYIVDEGQLYVFRYLLP